MIPRTKRKRRQPTVRKKRRGAKLRNALDLVWQQQENCQCGEESVAVGEKKRGCESFGESLGD